MIRAMSRPTSGFSSLSYNHGTPLEARHATEKSARMTMGPSTGIANQVCANSPACKTHALGTPAFSQTLQYLVLTLSPSKSLMIICPSSFPPRGATSIAFTLGNCATMAKHVLADPPRARWTEWARTTDEGSGWDDKVSVCVRKSVPDATMRRGRWKGKLRRSWLSGTRAETVM